MTLNDFNKITKQCGILTFRASLDIPNAVCVSRKIYNDLKAEFERKISIKYDDSEMYQEHVFGFALFVDDDMPDDFYCVGQAKVFIDYFTAKKAKQDRMARIQVLSE